eukprot:scaffold5039_cov255-Pinguiococcus_pyrenoidosus.AAC.2
MTLVSADVLIGACVPHVPDGKVCYALSRLFHFFNEQIQLEETLSSGTKHQALRALLSVLSILDLSLEKIAKNRGERARDTVIIVVEALRCAVKLYIVSQEREIFTNFEGKGSRRAIEGEWEEVSTNLERESAEARSEGDGLLLLGEILHILRPFLFCVIERLVLRRQLRRLGKGEGPPNSYGSWLLLAGSFWMDFLSDRSSGAALARREVDLLELGVRSAESLRSTTGPRTGTGILTREASLTRAMMRFAEQKEELRRRKMQWLLYLLRSPLFQLICEPVAKTTDKVLGRAPLIGSLSNYAMQLLMHIQSHHFYTSGSS